MSVLDGLLDRYSLLARQRPALLMLFPAAVAVLVIFPALQAWWTTLLTLIGACGVALALGEFAQGCGKLLEPGLYAAWGGMPSVAMLRHRDATIDARTKARYKTFLETQVNGLRFPTEVEEQRDPSSADQAYASASNWLRSQTRDTRKFALLLRQNIGYGFRRNLLGLRPYGLAIAAFSLLAPGSAAWVIEPTLGPAIIIAVIVSIGALIFWIFVVKPDWVKISAEAYARELLAACDTLATAMGTPQRKKAKS
jgi:hypothetical protein